METPLTCPACGARDALLALGVRYDHPHRWRPWVTTRTQLYLCDSCDELVAMPESADGEGKRAPAHKEPIVEIGRGRRVGPSIVEEDRATSAA